MPVGIEHVTRAMVSSPCQIASIIINKMQHAAHDPAARTRLPPLNAETTTAIGIHVLDPYVALVLA
jgi:hypothetical protein